MSGTGLRHIAIIAGGALGASGEPRTIVVEAARNAAALAETAFSSVPGLQACSFIAPGIDRLLDGPGDATAALRGCADAAAILEAAAARCGAVLRLCGRARDLPADLARRAGHRAAEAEKTLLWFLRYGGRDEIVRAAARFFSEHPGATLGDEDLDAYLDTAGVPDPDLIILAGGPLEAPDALVWQGSYAELWHTSTPWVAFGAEDLRRAVADYHTRQRRFGG